MHFLAFSSGPWLPPFFSLTVTSLVTKHIILTSASLIFLWLPCLLQWTLMIPLGPLGESKITFPPHPPNLHLHSPFAREGKRDYDVGILGESLFCLTYPPQANFLNVSQRRGWESDEEWERTGQLSGIWLPDPRASLAGSLKLGCDFLSPESMPGTEGQNETSWVELTEFRLGKSWRQWRRCLVQLAPLGFASTTLYIALFCSFFLVPEIEPYIWEIRWLILFVGLVR